MLDQSDVGVGLFVLQKKLRGEKKKYIYIKNELG